MNTGRSRAKERALALSLCQFSFVFVIAVAADTSQLDNLWVGQTAAELFSVLLDNLLGCDALFGSQLRALGLAYLLAVQLGGLDALTRALMQVFDLFL